MYVYTGVCITSTFDFFEFLCLIIVLRVGCCASSFFLCLSVINTLLFEQNCFDFQLCVSSKKTRVMILFLLFFCFKYQTQKSCLLLFFYTKKRAFFVIQKKDACVFFRLCCFCPSCFWSVLVLPIMSVRCVPYY